MKSLFSFLKPIVFGLLRYSGLPWVLRNSVQRDRVTILLFHDIDKKTAESTFDFLTKRYNIIDLNDFISAIISNTKSILPKNAMIITFDDGLIGNYKMLPIIEKFKIPITIFLCSSIIDTNRNYWFKFMPQEVPLKVLKKMKNNDKLKRMKLFGYDQNKEYDKPQALTRQHIAEMKTIVNFQSHTKYHPCLPKCEDNEAKDEISGSKIELEDSFGLRINSIAYPNGDYCERDIQLCKEANYSCGITLDNGYNTIASDLFRLKRFSVNDTKDLNELSVKSSGLWSYLKRNRK